MDCAKPPEWYIRLRREKSPSAMADKQFTLEQLFSRPYHTVDAAASSSGSGRQKSNGIVGGGILLGRQSSSQPEGPDTRGFASPIVSRTHAQLLVTRSGHVYIADLSSLHGTTITPLDKAERTFTLTPMTPTQLLEGDTLILGKTVLASDRAHDPIRLVVEFAYPAAGLSAAGTRDILHTGRTDVAYGFASDRHADAILRAVALEALEIKPKPHDVLDFTAKATTAVVEVISVPSSPEEADVTRREDRDSSAMSLSPVDSSSGRYGLPESLLYISGDEEDLPRGDRSHVREQTDDSAVSTSYSLPSLQNCLSPATPRRDHESLPAPQAVRPLAEKDLSFIGAERPERATRDYSFDGPFAYLRGGSYGGALDSPLAEPRTRDDPASPVDLPVPDYHSRPDQSSFIPGWPPMPSTDDVAETSFADGSGLPAPLSMRRSTIELNAYDSEPERLQEEGAQAQAEEEADLGMTGLAELDGMVNELFEGGDDHLDLDDHQEDLHLNDSMDFSESMDLNEDEDVVEDGDNNQVDDHNDETDVNDEDRNGPGSDDGFLDDADHLEEDDHEENWSGMAEVDYHEDDVNEAPERNVEEPNSAISVVKDQLCAAGSVTLKFGDDHLPKLVLKSGTRVAPFDIRPAGASWSHTESPSPPPPQYRRLAASVPDLDGPARGLLLSSKVRGFEAPAEDVRDDEKEFNAAQDRIEASSLLARLLEKKHGKQEEEEAVASDSEEESDDGGSYVDEEDEQEAIHDEEDYAYSQSDDEVASLDEEQAGFAIDRPALDRPSSPLSVDESHVAQVAATPRVGRAGRTAARSDAVSPPPRDPDYGTWYSYSDHEDDDASGLSRPVSSDKQATRLRKLFSEITECSREEEMDMEKIFRSSVVAKTKEVIAIKQEKSATPVLPRLAAVAFGSGPPSGRVDSSSFGQETPPDGAHRSETLAGKEKPSLIKHKAAPSPRHLDRNANDAPADPVSPCDLPGSPGYCFLSPPPERTSPSMSPMSPRYSPVSPRYSPVSPDADHSRSMSPVSVDDEGRADTQSLVDSDGSVRDDEDAASSDEELSAEDDDVESKISEEDGESAAGMSEDDSPLGEEHEDLSEDEDSSEEDDLSEEDEDESELSDEEDGSDNDDAGDLSEDDDEQVSEDDDEEGEDEDEDVAPARACTAEHAEAKGPLVIPELAASAEGSVVGVSAEVTDEVVSEAASRIVEPAMRPVAAPWSSPAASTSSSGSDAYPVTPPTTKRPLKRSHDETVDVASVSDTDIEMANAPTANKVQKVNPGDITQGQVAVRPERNGYMKTAGLIALGAVFGSVGTIAGLMQLAD